MKVGLVTSIARGGPVEQCLLLARGLALRGVSVRAVCATPEVAERFAAAGAHTTVAPLRHQGDVRGARRVWRSLGGVDVVHAHDRRAGLWTRIGPRPCRRGVRVYTVHGLPEPYHPPPAGRERPGAWSALRYRWLDAALCSRADAVVVPSQAVARELVARLRFPAAKITVIPNGVELPEPSPPGGELIGTLSLLEPVKGLDVFLRAVALVARERPDWRFALFGTGSERARLAALKRELALEGRVECPGFVPASDALRRLRVFVLPSYAENAPVALLEAMASGVPVVASAVGGVPEILDERVGWLVPSGDPAALAGALLQAGAGGEEAAGRARAARERVEARFTAAHNVEATLGLYRRLLSQRSP